MRITLFARGIEPLASAATRVSDCKATRPRTLLIVGAFLALSLTGLLLPAGRSQTTTQYLLSGNRCDTGTVWFQTQQSPLRAAGVVELGSGFFQTSPPPSLPVYQGGSLSWTPNNVYVTLMGGGVTTVEVLTPAGAAITGTQGIVTLASGFIVTVDTTTGVVLGAALNAAAYVYTVDKVYLVLVGGGLTTVEVTGPTGASLAGVKGIGVIGGDIQDNPATVPVEAIAQGAVLIYTDSQVCLHAIGGGSVIVEVLDPAGATITDTRGVAAMASLIPPPGLGGLEGAAYVWTDSNVYLILVGGGLVTAEITAPGGGSIAGAWGVVKLDGGIFATAAGTLFQGAAHIVTPSSLYVTVTGGGIATVEVVSPAGSPIATTVSVPSSISQQRQARQLYQISGQIAVPSGPPKRGAGTIIGLDQF